ncbi:MAG: cytochrome c maturation protein CcmE [Bacteroidetes bacterium]|nr:cytochrome c maturation protein CcmE [Bacteroidota bacterium]
MNKYLIFGLLAIAVAIGYIVSLSADVSTYVTFDTAAQNEGREFHIVGKVNFNKPQEYNPQTNANLFTFYMNDTLGNEKKVLLNKAKPQDFEKSQQVVVIGKMQSGDFIASDILMKCPSKYNEVNENTVTTDTITY